MGSKAKKDRRNADILDGKTSPPFVAASICFVIYARMEDLFGHNVRRDIELFVLCPRLAYAYKVASLTLAAFCII